MVVSTIKQQCRSSAWRFALYGVSSHRSFCHCLEELIWSTGPWLVPTIIRAVSLPSSQSLLKVKNTWIQPGLLSTFAIINQAWTFYLWQASFQRLLQLLPRRLSSTILSSAGTVSILLSIFHVNIGYNAYIYTNVSSDIKQGHLFGSKEPWECYQGSSSSCWEHQQQKGMYKKDGGHCTRSRRRDGWLSGENGHTKKTIGGMGPSLERWSAEIRCAHFGCGYACSSLFIDAYWFFHVLLDKRLAFPRRYSWSCCWDWSPSLQERCLLHGCSSTCTYCSHRRRQLQHLLWFQD